MNNQQNNKNDKNDKDNKKKNAKILAIFLIVSILGTFFFNSILTKWRNGTEKTISYNKFVTMLDQRTREILFTRQHIRYRGSAEIMNW